MRRSLKLALDSFGRATLEFEAERYSVSPDELVGHAVEYYLSDRRSGRAALRVPRFGRKPVETTIELDVDLPARTWDEAEAESQRQGVSLERLLEHTAMYLVADLDSGNVAARIAAEASIADDR